MLFLKSHYFWRTYLGYVAVALAGTFIFAISLVRDTQQQILQKTEADLASTAELLSLSVNPALQSLSFENIRATALSVNEISGLRITVIDSNGIVIADTHENPVTMENHFRRPEIQMAILNGEGKAQRYSFTLEEDFRYLARPIGRQGEISGFIRVAKSATDLEMELASAEALLIRNSTIITFIILILAFYLAMRQATKVAEVTALAAEIAEGNFARRIPEGNSLGLRKMAEAINQMARSSARSMTEVTADRNRLSTIFTCMVEGVIDVDMEQNILHINEAAARLLDVGEKTSVGKPLWEIIRNQEIISALDEAIKNQSINKTQIRLSRDSVQRVVDIYAASLSDDEGAPIGAVLVLHDITDLKNLERVRTDFVANASHELKTPITAIRGLTETILGDDEVEKDTLIHFIERVHSQSLRLSQLVGDLMAISRLESTQASEEFTRINFSDLVRQAVKAAQTPAEVAGHKLEAEIHEGDIEIMGERQNLSQLVDNLIDNAIKYTPDPGNVSVKLWQEGGTAILEVKDTGIGISPQFQQRVFERFYRVDKARSQSLGGTGLGLSIVKNITEKHGGSVSVNSQLGNGSTFTLRLPIAD